MAQTSMASATVYDSNDTDPDISSSRQTEFDVFSFSDQTEDPHSHSEARSRQTTTSLGALAYERSVDTITDTNVSQFDDHSVFEEVFGKGLRRQDSFPEIGCEDENGTPSPLGSSPIAAEPPRVDAGKKKKLPYRLRKEKPGERTRNSSTSSPSPSSSSSSSSSSSGGMPPAPQSALGKGEKESGKDKERGKEKGKGKAAVEEVMKKS